MAKKIKTFIKLNIRAGAATAAPPVGPALGQHGLPIMDFVKAFNDKTEAKKGDMLPVVITVYEDRTFSFITKEPPVAEMIKKAMNKEKGSGKPGREFVATLSKAQVEEIAKAKMPDLNANDVPAAMKIVEGTARSMGSKGSMIDRFKQLKLVDLQPNSTWGEKYQKIVFMGIELGLLGLSASVVALPKASLILATGGITLWSLDKLRKEN